MDLHKTFRALVFAARKDTLSRPLSSTNSDTLAPLLPLELLNSSDQPVHLGGWECHRGTLETSGGREEPRSLP